MPLIPFKVESALEKAVTGRVNTILGQEKKNAMQAKRAMEAKTQAEEFNKEHKVSDEDYEDMVDWARIHKLSIGTHHQKFHQYQ